MSFARDKISFKMSVQIEPQQIYRRYFYVSCFIVIETLCCKYLINFFKIIEVFVNFYKNLKVFWYGFFIYFDDEWRKVAICIIKLFNLLRKEHSVITILIKIHRRTLNIQKRLKFHLYLLCRNFPYSLIEIFFFHVKLSILKFFKCFSITTEHDLFGSCRFFYMLNILQEEVI